MDTIYYLMTDFLLCRILHISDGDIHVGLKIYCVSVYEIQINTNHFSARINISLHVIICVTENFIMNDLSYNSQFDILDGDKNDFYNKHSNSTGMKFNN